MIPRQQASLAALSLLLTALLAACGALRTSSGPEADAAILEGCNRLYFVYWEEANISAVDGVRPELPALWASSVRLSPGLHWIEVTKHSTIGGYTVCALESEFRAEHRCKLAAHSMHIDAPYLEQPYEGSCKGALSREISGKGPPSHTLDVAAVCAPRGASPQLCRQDADCKIALNQQRQSVLDSSFGVCTARES